VEISALILDYGLWAVFLAILLEQFGLPIPTLPLLLIVGAAAATDPGFGVAALLAATLASTLGGSVLYMAGRRYGDYLIGIFCRISLSPTSCINRGLSALEQVGPFALLMARFVPGLAAMAPALAGKAGMRFRVFLISQGVAAALFATVGILAGYTFHDTIDQFLYRLDAYGKPIAIAFGSGVAAWAIYVFAIKRYRTP
jgi:membrane protein DedA with SNARE-associated domain